MRNVQLAWTTADGLPIFAQAWDPEDSPRAVLCLVHGLGEHSGRYAHVALQLTAAGLSLLAFDLRGHGRSGGPRGHAPTYEHLMDDIELLLQQSEQRYPNLPRFLYGHSLGGNLTLYYLLNRRPSVAGAIVTAPFLGTAFEPPQWKLALGRILYSAVPGFAMNNSLDPRGLSRDPEIARAYQSDPLVHDRVSARLGLDMINSGKWLVEHAGQLKTPVLLMQGGADPVVSPTATRAFAASAPPTCTFVEWQPCMHEIHNEPEKQDVVQRMIVWVDERLTA